MPSPTPRHDAISESIRSVYELSTRIDERVRLLMKRQEILDVRAEKDAAAASDLASRVCVLESRTTAALEGEVAKLREAVQELQITAQGLRGDSGRAGERWRQVVSFGLQLAVALVSAWALLKLGLRQH